MEKIRTFIAVDISDAVRARASDLIERLRASQVKVSWVNPQNLHLTLKFLGEVPNVQVPDVCQAVAQAVAPMAPFEAAYRGAGAFPNLRSPRTVWLGVERGEQQLVALHQAVDPALATLGFAPEHRSYRPHLTLGRVRQGGPKRQELAKLLEKHADFQAGSAPVAEVLVFASFLDKHGPTYNVLGRAPLEG